MTANITVTLTDTSGDPLVGARVNAKLFIPDRLDDFTVPEDSNVTGTTDEKGQVTLALWPNSANTDISTYYRFRAWHPVTKAKVLDVCGYVDVDAALEHISYDCKRASGGDSETVQSAALAAHILSDTPHPNQKMTGAVNTDDYTNTWVGVDAFSSYEDGNTEHCTAFGSSALKGNYYGWANTGFGYFALGSNVDGQYNCAFGYALPNMIDGDSNTAIGDNACANLENGDRNTAVGRFALYDSQSIRNCSALGYNARVTGDDQVQLGNSSTTTYVYGTVQNRSDARDKADIRDTVLGLDFVNALRPVDYRWDMREYYRPERPEPLRKGASDEEKAAHEYAMAAWRESSRLSDITSDGSKKRLRYHHGLIAQEVRAVMEAMGVDFGGFQDHSINGGEDVLSLGYDEFIAPLIKAVQELAAENRAIKERLANLEQ